MTGSHSVIDRVRSEPSAMTRLLAPPAFRLAKLALVGLSIALGAISAVCATQVRAHAPPEVIRLVWKSASDLTLVSNRGLMFASGAAGGFRLMCNEALHITHTEQPNVAYRRDGALLAATSEGVFLTTDQGCTWQPVPSLTAVFVSALTQRPGDPDSMFAATFGPGQSALWVTHDGSRSWSVLQMLGDHDYTRVLLVAEQEPTLLYASGSQLIDTPTPHVLHYCARSTNAGQTWERSDVPLNENELGLLLLAVNPSDKNELLARASSASPGFVRERLLLSRDGGKTFSALSSFLSITGAAFSADGKDAWVVGVEGLFHAGPARDTFARIGGAAHLTCVDYRHGKLWTCGNYDGDAPLLDGVGQSSDPSAGTFETFMTFNDVASPVSCPASAPTESTCRAPWQDFHDEVFQGPSTDAGREPDAGSGALLDAALGPDEAEPSSEPDAGPSATNDTQPAEPAAEPRSSRCAVSSAGYPGPTSAPGALTLCTLAALGLCRASKRRTGSLSSRR